jgi:hypothetical protein
VMRPPLAQVAGKLPWVIRKGPHVGRIPDIVPLSAEATVRDVQKGRVRQKDICV